MSQNKKIPLRLLLKILAPPAENKGLFVTVVLLTFCMATLEALGVGSLAPLIALVQSSDQFLNSKTGEFLSSILPVNSEDELLLYLGGGLVAIFISKMIVTILHAYFQHSYSQTFYSSISSKLLSGYTKMSFHFHSRQNSAILTRNVTTETRLIVDNIVLQAITVTSELLVCTLLISVLFYLDPVVAIYVCGSSGILLLSMLLITRKVGAQLGLIRDQQQQHMIKMAQSVLTGLKEILLSGRKSYFLDRFEFLAHSYAKSVTIIGFIQVIPRMALEAIALLALLSAFLYTKSHGSMENDLPLLVTYIVAGYRLLPSFNRIFVSGLMIYYVIPTLRQTLPSLLKAYEVTEEKINVISEPIESLTLRDITFRYEPDANDVLKDITLNLQKGDIAGIVGPSGAGKSTLIGILLGLLQPQKGTIFWNTTSLKSAEDVRGLQTQVAYVAQNVFIADDTLLANIALGETEDTVDQERLARALDIAQLNEVIQDLPHGLNSQIGENAAMLSGGQAQRVGIARAIYTNRPLLVLDEATSALDIQTEKRILDALAADKKSRITVVIAHRTTALSDCDYIYKLSGGTLDPACSFKAYLQHLDRQQPN
jgi:ABC-type bacteriocin/lantibiotic exporter with double-glycine peptidase domain